MSPWQALVTTLGHGDPYAGMSAGARAMAAAGAQNREIILDLVRRLGPVSLSAVVTGTALSRETVRKHLYALADDRLVRRESYSAWVAR